MRDTRPVEGPATILTFELVHEKPESGKPGSCQDQIQRPAIETGREREKPKQAEKNGDSSNDFGVNKALPRPGIALVEVVKVPSDDAGDDLEASQWVLSRELLLETCAGGNELAESEDR
jgi:hypothetical protein